MMYIRQVSRLLFLEYEVVGVARVLKFRLLQIACYILCFRPLLFYRFKKTARVVIVNRPNRISGSAKTSCNTTIALLRSVAETPNYESLIQVVDDPLSFSNIPRWPTTTVSWIRLPVAVIGVILNTATLPGLPFLLFGYYWAIMAYVKPQAVFCIMPSVALCRACRLRGVRIYDVQHGAISRDHPWYRLRSPVGHSRFFSDSSPTHYLVWDTASRQQLVDMGISNSVIAIYGTPIASRSMHDEHLPALFGNYLYRLVITLQYSLWFEGDVGILADNYLSRLRLIENSVFIFRQHPMVPRSEALKQLESITKLKRLIHPSSSIYIDNATPLEDLLALSCGHLTINSSSAIIASHYGSPTILMDPSLPDDLARLYSAYPLICLPSNCLDEQFAQWWTMVEMRSVEPGASQVSSVFHAIDYLNL
jgi:hypothetical protein